MVKLEANQQSIKNKVKKVECACEMCSILVSKDDYTFPYCVQCYAMCI